MTTLIKIRINQLGEGYQWYKAREPRQCHAGHTIQKGERYVRFFTVDKSTDPAKLEPIANVCLAHLNRCENCGSPMFNAESRRFCSDSCGQRHFDRAQIEAEEKEFWEEECVRVQERKQR
jgi:hypothetical protein